jgi:hypothetical protein
VLNAERQCDVLLRDVRRALAEHVSDAATLNLSTDFAQALESATDWLLATGYGLRRLALQPRPGWGDERPRTTRRVRCGGSRCRRRRAGVDARASTA